MRGSFQLEAITPKDTFYCKALVLEKKNKQISIKVLLFDIISPQHVSEPAHVLIKTKILVL